MTSSILHSNIGIWVLKFFFGGGGRTVVRSTSSVPQASFATLLKLREEEENQFENILANWRMVGVTLL